VVADDGGVDASDHGSSLLVGVSPPIQELRTIIKQVSGTNLNCLIRGERGWGEDIVAREIHRLSPRSDKPFIKVNCSALPEQLLESELFGDEKGAFTGAVSSKPGRFSLADHGIIFLDEICEMHPNLQAKFLQVIEHKEFVKLGGRDPVKVDVQIIAATNANIEEMTKVGSFRQDLFFRLNEVCIWSPPLSKRREDVPLLVRHFLKKYQEFSGGSPLDLSGEDLAELSAQDWPGNIRELESTIKRWLVLGKQGQPVVPLGGDAASGEAPKQTRISELSPEQILERLEACQWNRGKAADSLGISYQALRRRIEKFKLNEQR
jgi:two-component system response regulator AtoC